MYNHQHLSCASKGSYSLIFQYAAGILKLSFETVRYLAFFSKFPAILIIHPTAWILDKYRERD